MLFVDTTTHPPSCCCLLWWHGTALCGVEWRQRMRRGDDLDNLLGDADIHLQGETMVDCGGSNCDACAADEATAEASCDPTCFDRPPRADLDYCQFAAYVRSSCVWVCVALVRVHRACVRASRVCASS